MAHQIGRHVHPAAKTDTTAPAPATGIDYLALVRDRHTTALAQRVNYAAMSEQADPATAADNGADEVDAALAADIASFAAYRDQLATARASGAETDEVLPGQTDLLDLLHPTDDNDDTEETL